MKSTERALKACKDRAWPAGLVERSVPTGGNQFIRTRKDLFNCIDIVCLDGWNGVLGIQACLGDVTAHYAKISDTPEIAPLAVRFIEAGNRLEVWGFRKLKVKRGGKAVRWTLRRSRAFVAGGRIGFSEID